MMSRSNKPASDKSASDKSAKRNSKKSEARGHYRVKRFPTTMLRVTIDKHDGSSRKGECNDISIAGAGVRFPTRDNPLLYPGQIVYLRFQLESRENFVNVRAEVRSVSHEGLFVRYGFLFLNTIEIFCQLDAAYALLFNRRQHPRVTSGLGQATTVKVSWPRGDIDVKLHDISMGGIGIAVTQATATRLRGVKEVQLSVRIPGQSTAIEVRARICSEASLGNQVLFGLAFEADASLERAQDALRGFVEERLATLERLQSHGTKRKSA
jgi:c-di-GMP-binding flagellar brake protein YcgR